MSDDHGSTSDDRTGPDAAFDVAVPDVDGPHQGQQLHSAGTDLEAADAAVVMVHGRGATARGILGMADQLPREGVTYLAPQAAGNTWYPHPFTAPVERNEPGRTSGLRAIADAIERAAGAGIDPDRVLVLGFSQGACLASEFVARHPRRYGGLAVLSGGLIGESIDPTEYEGDGEADLAGTPAFFGCSDADPHIPERRVRESASVLENLGADVTVRIYEGMGHGVNEDELAYVREMVGSLQT